MKWLRTGMRLRLGLGSILVVAVVVGLLATFAPSGHHNTATGGDTVEKDQLRAVPAASSGSCGVERWPVKTGTDADAGQINLSNDVSTTVAALRALPAPQNLPQNNRIKPTETTVFVLNATLTLYKLEGDSDYHLILADSAGSTMITEIPDPACVGSSSPLLQDIKNARAEMDHTYHVTTSFQTANVPVKVIGVGFFDFLHGQTGVAPNGIELHAVLDIQFNPGTTTTTTVPSTTSTTAATTTTTIGGTTTTAPTTTTTSPGGSQLLGNPGFENGSANPAPWSATGRVINNNPTQPPRSGQWDAWLDGYGHTNTDTLSQTVAVPSGVSSATLTFWLHIDTAESTTTRAYDKLTLQVLSPSHQVLSTLHTWSNLDHAPGYHLQRFDLSSFAGKTITLKFTGAEDYELQTSFVIDDTALNVA